MIEQAIRVGRRLRLVEIAVLADDDELRLVFQNLSDALINPAAVACVDQPPVSINVYDGADLPRSLQAELLEEILEVPADR